jgi:hypothetical protein
MGSEASSPEGERDPIIQSTHSYFGSSGKIGQSDGRDLEERLRAFQDRRASPPQPSSEGIKLKTFLSIGAPDPAISVVNGSYCISFGIRSECPGRVVIIARSEISSMRFPVSDRLLISLPIPEIDGFVIDISLDIDQFSGVVEQGFDSVAKHVLDFELFDSGESIQFTFARQKLFVANSDRSYVITVNQQCALDPKEGEVCFTCLTNVPDVAIADCGHCVICNDCLCGRGVRLHHCPLCHAPTTF